MRGALFVAWLGSVVALVVFLAYRQLQCIDCTRMRIIADNWPAYVAVLVFGSIVYIIFRYVEKR